LDELAGHNDWRLPSEDGCNVSNDNTTLPHCRRRRAGDELPSYDIRADVDQLLLLGDDGRDPP
jgi:hypothetical protein